MTRITTGCPRCGRVELGIDEITLVVSPWEDNAWYVFDCLGCAHRVVKPAPSSVVSALTSVHVEISVVPAEVLERAQPDESPPISTDDLLDALLWLQTCHGPGGPLADVTPIDAGADRPGEISGVTNPSSGEEGSRPAHPNAA